MDPSWQKVADKALDKIPVDKIYEDLFQPSFKKAGEALATVMDTANTVLFPIAWLNERRKLYLTDNLKKYAEKLNAVNQDAIEIPDFVAIPILEKLSQTSQKELSETFINLLTKASFEKTVHLVHPSFVNALANLSSDEAKLLFYLKEIRELAFIDIRLIINGGRTYRDLGTLLTGLEFYDELDFPKNIDLYLINLDRLGIIKIDRSSNIENLRVDYEKLEGEIYKDVIDRYKSEYCTVATDEQAAQGVEPFRFHISITDYGTEFRKACIYEIDLPAST